MNHIDNPPSVSVPCDTSAIDALSRMQFADSLIGYLDIRQWAFEKIRTSPVGSNLIDLRMHHYLYFSNLFGAIDLVRDCLSDSAAKNGFDAHLAEGFPVAGDYLYARELRNAIVHRGLDPAAQGAQVGENIFAITPPVVFHRDGKKAYACSSPLLVNLAAACNKASNPAIFAVAEREGLLDSAAYRLDMSHVMEWAEETEHMPEWAHDMAEEAFSVMDYDALSAELAESRVHRLQLLLGGGSAGYRELPTAIPRPSVPLVSQ
jgi:hypothetical protein